jgi:H/ACA ribonucleoprotein complex subunit 2
MAKDKSEKKKKHTSEAAPAAVDEDVEMEGKEVGDQFRLGQQQSNTRTQKTVKSPKKEERDEIVIPLEDLSPIAHPLAQKKLMKKLQKTIKRGESSQCLFIAKVPHRSS